MECKEWSAKMSAVPTQNNYGLSTPKDVASCSLLARRALGQGMSHQAEGLYKQALELKEQSCQGRDLELTENLADLAGFYWQRDKFIEAEPLLKRILSIKQAGDNPVDKLFVQSSEQLALIYERTGKAQEAEVLYRELLKIQEEKFGHEASVLIFTLTLLAEHYVRQNKFSKAEPLYLRVLALQEFEYGTYSVEINSTVRALVAVFEKQGKRTLAEFMLKKQESILTAIHGEDALCVANCIVRRAELLLGAGRIDDAEIQFKRVLEIYKKSYGSQSNAVASFSQKIATLYANASP